MRRFVILAMLCTATASAAAAVADAPFAPSANIPDYVVTVIEHQSFVNKEKSRSVIHHGDWTRVDTVEGPHKWTTYFAGNGSLEISQTGNDVDSYIELKLRPRAIGWDTEPRKTGERETFLDESCTVWNVQRLNRPGDNQKLEKLSCVTDDGIELWHRYIGSDGIMSSGEATSIKRRSVAIEDVQPPQDLLALGSWNKDEGKASLSQPDFEALLEVREGMRVATADDGRQHIRTIRRRYPWTYVEDKEGGVLRRLTITEASGRMRLSFVGPGGGGDAESSLVISRRPSAQQPSSETKLKDMNSSETILGEECRWFDLMPGAADAGAAECRTDDGIPLQQSTWSRGSRTLSIAVSLARRPLALDDVKPPREMLSLDWWTKEDHH